MASSCCYPYRSAAARELYFEYYDALAAKQWPVASEERLVPTPSGDTFVRITGPADAPPLVLLSGGVSTSLMWAPNIGALSEHYRTFAVDRIGEVGRTTCTRPVRSIGDMLRWLDEFFDALKLADGINLMGMSFGGALAAQYMLHAPERTGKAVLLAPAVTVLRLRIEFMARLMLAAVASKKGLPALFHWMFADAARKDPEWMEVTLDGLFWGMRSLQPGTVPIPPLLTDSEWAGLKVPVLFLVGEHETIYNPRKAVNRLNRVAPRVQTAIIPDAGHDLTFAQADMVNRTVLEFLGQEKAAITAR